MQTLAQSSGRKHGPQQPSAVVLHGFISQCTHTFKIVNGSVHFCCDY